MKHITFDYTKKDGSTSSRSLLAMVVPGNKYAGIDVSEVDPEVAEHFIQRVKKLHDEYVAALQELQDVYDVKHNYRQFLESGMTNITEI